MNSKTLNYFLTFLLIIATFTIGSLIFVNKETNLFDKESNETENSDYILDEEVLDEKSDENEYSYKETIKDDDFTSSTIKSENNSREEKKTTNTKNEEKEINSQSEIDYTEKDNKVINTMSNLTAEVDTLLKENGADAKNKAKGIFITIVDFIFYDGKINDITFAELSDKGKEKVLEIANTIDSKIEVHFPGYKDTISKKAGDIFNEASEIIKEGATDLSEFSREQMGEENYQKFLDAKSDLTTYVNKAKDMFKDFSSSAFESVTTKLKNWYEKFKSSYNS